MASTGSPRVRQKIRTLSFTPNQRPRLPYLPAASSLTRCFPLAPRRSKRAAPIGFALYFLFSPRVSDLDSQERLGRPAFALTIGLGVGFYDGFFGPGTGTFFAMGYVALLGYSLRRATAHSKLLNFVSNLAALLLFLPGGHIDWTIAAVMALGQGLGAWLGSHLVIRHGAALVRPVLVVASLVISAKLLLDQMA